MHRENYINSLRGELLATVAERLTPIALRYGYSDVALETNIKWRPLVLVLGNYSAGKSALINEFLGADIQATGQAPTDDSFTVITHDGSLPSDAPVRTTEERDGKYLLNDPEYPFEMLKKHGQRFASHFRLKKVNAPFLRTLAVIDTPGMLDSITERDRGYNYQEVVGDLAQLADLILVLFDPHKAGTIREAHISLRDTLPTRTFEDRVLYVLNRIDECASLIDLIRVYGTLCWNLSQITGRKDIPPIHLTYSPRAAAESRDSFRNEAAYLPFLENQREYLKQSILKAPRHRLDHLATFVETHSERIAHFLEALTGYRKQFRRFWLRSGFLGVLVSFLAGGVIDAGLLYAGLLPGLSPVLHVAVAGGLSAAVMALWLAAMLKWFRMRFHRRQLKKIDALTPLDTQTRRDTWQGVRDVVYAYLEKTGGRFSGKLVGRDHAEVREVYEKGTREIREALSELASTADSERGPAAIRQPQVRQVK